MGKKFFRVRVVRHWHSLPGGAVNAPSLQVLKSRLDTLSQPSLVEGVPAHGVGGLE